MPTKTILSIILILVGIAAIWFLPKKNSQERILSIPFTPQAPTGNWEDNKDCEEASIAMVKAYYEGKRVSVRPPDAVESIKKLNDWEKANLGFYRDTGAEDTARMAREVYGFRTNIIADYTAEDLKKEIRAGNPILLPINAGLLNNPKYVGQEPFYHMFVIKGYSDDLFIVNDPGTESGSDNVYSFETLWNAAADWNQGAQAMDPGVKVALVLTE